MAQGGTHGNLDKARVANLAAQCEHLGALGFFGAHGTEPVGALEYDLRHVGVGLDVVQNSGAGEQTLDRRERRAGTRLAALTLDGGHQSRFLTADERARAETDLQIEIEAGAENVLAQ